MATIRKRGVKWQVQVRRIGCRPVSRSFLMLKDAEAWARQSEVQADRRELPSDPKLLNRITLGELVERYRDTVSIKKRGYDVERIVLTAFLRHPICRKRLSEMRPEDFALYRDQRLQEIELVTLKRQLAPIQNLFEVARYEWGLPIRENPLTKLALKGPPRRRERRITEEEFDRIIDAAGRCRNPHIRPIIHFAIETGLRRGEMLNMQWAEISCERRELVIALPKNGHSRTIPLTKRALEILGNLPVTQGRVFPITANSFRLAWERVRERAKVANLHFHDLRHEAISRFFERGLSLPEVVLLSGHRDPRMLLRYTHALRVEIMRKLDDA